MGSVVSQNRSFCTFLDNEIKIVRLEPIVERTCIVGFIPVTTYCHTLYKV
jgi:hypothetical protein